MAVEGDGRARRRLREAGELGTGVGAERGNSGVAAGPEAGAPSAESRDRSSLYHRMRTAVR